MINIEVAGCLSIGESGLIGPQASDMLKVVVCSVAYGQSGGGALECNLCPFFNPSETKGFDPHRIPRGEGGRVDPPVSHNSLDVGT